MSIGARDRAMVAIAPFLRVSVVALVLFAGSGPAVGMMGPFIDRFAPLTETEMRLAESIDSLRQLTLGAPKQQLTKMGAESDDVAYFILRMCNSRDDTDCPTAFFLGSFASENLQGVAILPPLTSWADVGMQPCQSCEPVWPLCFAPEETKHWKWHCVALTRQGAFFL